MYRFVSLVWNGADARAASVADFIAGQLHATSPHTWEKVYGRDGLMVFQSGAYAGRMQAYRLQNNGGVVLGRLFQRDAKGLYPSKTDDFSTFESQKCLQTKGQHLVDNYWGRYITFLDDTAANAKYIMRDPCGDFPCFSTPYRGVDVYFSDMEDCARFEFLAFSANFDHIREEIMTPLLQKISTGLNEVAEVLPAQCREIGPDGTKSRFTWDPARISQTDMVEDPEEAAVLLRRVTKNCIAAWAGCYNNILHKIGGLDSSIVLACLADAPNRPDITCTTFFSPVPSGDERYFTRQAAKQAGVPLYEHEISYKNANLERFFHMNKLAHPFPSLNGIDRARTQVDLAKKIGAEAVFSGVGGDQIFFYFPRPVGAFDYVQKHGFDRNLFRILMEASRYGRRSLPSLLSDILKDRYIGSSASPHKIVCDILFGSMKTSLVNPDFLDLAFSESILHPLLVARNGMPKGKSLQILSSIFFNLEYYAPTDRSQFVEPVHPLFSQPLVELCLRIPTWVLTFGGVDRGLARKAFAKDLPADIIRRRAKGTPNDYYFDTHKHNIEFLREVLLDGILVREKILMRDKLEKALSGDDVTIDNEASNAISYASTEAWLRGWEDRKVRKIELAV